MAEVGACVQDHAIAHAYGDSGQGSAHEGEAGFL